MNKHLLLILLGFGGFEAFSQEENNNKFLVCEKSEGDWYAIKVNSDLEQISYLEFDDSDLLSSHTENPNWTIARNPIFTLTSISFGKKESEYKVIFGDWIMKINRETLIANIERWYPRTVKSESFEVACSIVEKDALEIKIDVQVKKNSNELNELFKRLRDEEEEQKKRNKI